MQPERVGQIRVLGVLGEGGMGTVFVGLDESLQRRVALKSVRDRYRLNPRAKARFLREARILSQLEHPGICRIHGYVEQDDQAYLVLELIEGARLSQHLSEGTLAPERRLAVAIEVASALAAAHALGIVHRDLKPDNVMITPEGRAKVLDFGVARVAPIDTAAPDRRQGGASGPARGRPGEVAAQPDGNDGPRVAAGDGDGDGGERDSSNTEWFWASDLSAAARPGPEGDPVGTRAGALVGTPEYMSPEQGRGEPVSTASDMYAFGLLLQLLFGRIAPEPGESGTLAAAAVRGRSGLLDGVPPDVAELVRRLLDPAPAARATAVEALERLRWIAARPARRARRVVLALALLLALAAGLKYTADLRHERGLAEARRNQAEALIGFMLGDLRDRLASLGRLDVLDAVGDEALAYFAQVPGGVLSDEELSRRSMALYQIGGVRVEQGDLPAAMLAFRESLALGQRLAQRNPGNPELLERLGFSHFWMGSGHLAAGQLDEALAAFEASRDVAAQLVAIDPDNAEWRLELASEEGNVGSVLEARDEPEAALRHYRDRLAEVADVVALDRMRTDWQVELATSHVLVGRVSEALGDLDTALSEYESDLAITAALVRAEPGDARWTERLATSHTYVGAARYRRGDDDGASRHYRASVALADELVTIDPSNAFWRDIGAIARRSLGKSLLRQGDRPRALGELRAALATLSDLARTDPARPRWHSEWARSELELGWALLADGATGLAEECARSAWERLHADVLPDDDPTVRLGRAECALLEGDVFARTRGLAAARESWNRVPALLGPAAQDSRDGRRLAPLAAAFTRLGQLEQARPLQERLAGQGWVDPRLAWPVDAGAESLADEAQANRGQAEQAPAPNRP